MHYPNVPSTEGNLQEKELKPFFNNIVCNIGKQLSLFCFPYQSVHRQISWQQSPGDLFVRIHTWYGFLQWVEDDTCRVSWASSYRAG